MIPTAHPRVVSAPRAAAPVGGRPHEPPAAPAGEESVWRLVARRLAQATSSGEPGGGHGRRVAALAHAIALALGQSAAEAEALRHAAALHDVGEDSIPRDRLPQPGPLLDEEFATSRMHTVLGFDLLRGSGSPVLELAATIALRHHERWDGSGYPDGLAGEDIPLPARIVAAADVLDALVHGRGGRAARPPRAAREELTGTRARQHDPAVLDALLRVLDAKGAEP